MTLNRGVRLAVAVGVALALIASTAGTAHAAIAEVSTSTAQTSGSGATSLTINKPGSVVAGDIEIATISMAPLTTITPPSGWTQLIDTQVGSSLRQTSFWHIATSSEGNVAWTFGATVQAAGGIVVYSGVDTTTIVDVASASTGTSGTSATAPSVTTTYASDLVISVASFNNTGSLTASSGTTSRFTAHTSGTNGPTILSEDATQSTAGATTARAITDNTSSTAWVGETIALKAASAAGVLSVTSSATPTFTASLDTGDATPTYTIPLTTVASVSSPPGWNETITSTTFTTGTHSLSTSASTIAAAPTVACFTAYANCVAATNAVTYPVNVPAGSTAPTAVKFVDAASGTGAGVFTVTPTITVSVPQNSFAGTYTSTVTIAIVSGP